MLKQYQQQGIDWLCKNKKGLLWFEMGLGKTLTALKTVEKMGCKKILVVAPASNLEVWVDESHKWLGEDGWFVAVRGSPKKREEFYGRDRIVVSYESVRSDISSLKGLGWDAIILDETLRIQNPISKTTKAILQLNAPVKIALNGTPISNGWGDIWATFTWLDPTCLGGNWYRFRAIYAEMNPYIPGMIVRWRDVDRIKKKVAHLYLRKTKAECLPELPELVEQTIRFSLGEGEKKMYNEVRKELILKLPEKEDEPIPNVLTELLRLRQITGGLFSEGGSKLEVLKGLAENVKGNGKKVIIFTSFAMVAKMLSEELDAFCIMGETEGTERASILKEFCSVKGFAVLIMTAAGEMGLNLQAASTIIHYDLPWSYARYEQRIARAWRLGQVETVMSYTLEAVGTVDEHVRKILERKVEVAEDFAGVSRKELVSLLESEPL